MCSALTVWLFLPHCLIQYSTSYCKRTISLLLLGQAKWEKGSVFKHCISLLIIILNKLSGEEMVKNEFSDKSIGLNWLFANDFSDSNFKKFAVV